MSKNGKIVVTILTIIGLLFISMLLTAADSSKALIGLIFLGGFYGLRSMWKKPNEKETGSEIKLNKDDESSITK